jgi:hypothetical protein
MRPPLVDLQTNVLSYGDNLDILRPYLPDAAVDLVASRYHGPDFSSQWRQPQHV